MKIKKIPFQNWDHSATYEEKKTVYAFGNEKIILEYRKLLSYLILSLWENINKIWGAKYYEQIKFNFENKPFKHFKENILALFMKMIHVKSSMILKIR